MRNRFFPLLAIFLFVFTGISAQNPDGTNFNSYYTDHYSNIVPSSPNASNFMQYGNNPVNASSGLPNISIPIYTIEEDGVQVPISISYNASGVKVDDVSSSVGLKWSLNAGGMISRTINDLDDFENAVGWTEAGSKSHFEQWLENNDPFNYQDGDSQINNLMPHISLYDNFPDDFNYSFLGYSGNFLLDTNMNIIQDKEDGLDFNVIGADEFNLGDKFGNEFHFSTMETNISALTSFVFGDDNYTNERDENNVGWMLDGITTKNSKNISFEYIPYEYDPYENSSGPIVSQRYVSTYYCAPESCTYPVNCSGVGNPQLMDDALRQTRLKNKTVNQLIHRIYTDNVEVSFAYVDGPINGSIVSGWDKRVDKIIVKDKILGKQKVFELKYGVFAGDARLKLLEVKEKGFDSEETKPPYVFSYNNSELPTVGSFAKDYRGYFNGKGGSSLFPRTAETLEYKRVIWLGPGTYPQIQRPAYSILSDRTYNEDKLKSGVLTSIEYPTGGKTEFDYEANAIGTNTYEPTIESVSIEIATHDNYYYYEGEYDTMDANYDVFNLLVDLTQLKGQISFESLGICPYCEVGSNGEYDHRAPKLQIYEYSGDINDSIDIEKRGTDIIGRSLSHSVSRPYLMFTDVYNIDYQFDGIYLVQLKVWKGSYILNGGPNGEMVHVLLNTYKNKTDSNGNTIFQKNYFGGLRVREIKDIDVDNKIYNKKTFNYLEGYQDSYSIIKSNENSKKIGNENIFSTDMILLPGSKPRQGYYYTNVEILNQNGNRFSRTIEKYGGTEGFKSIAGGDLMERKIYNETDDLIEYVQNEYNNPMGIVTNDLSFIPPPC